MGGVGGVDFMGVRFIFILNALIYFVAPPGAVFLFGAHYPFVETFHVHQIFTYMFFHGNFLHLAFNMFALYVFGTSLEVQWGTRRFLLYYFTCGVGASVIYLMTTMHKIDPEHLMIGASGAIFGLLLGFAMTFPNKILNIYFLHPIKAKYFAMMYAGIEILLGVINYNGDISAHFTHLGGMLTGFVFLQISYFLGE